ncbi:hypothetical protein AWB79_03318 [Caballeronia hypogeia]|uniref:Uncharacterized protein n=1 Tax=Caballeronia hypogeia TaxID=1777140 RepID=A0A158B9E2_9BURK|nr:hypothetical protein [Caballeronia hypogeia]SAK66695.1 hypothetical protein AWB79_03318 [Caballeronia hypogeia]
MPSIVPAPSPARRISASRPASALRAEVAKWFDPESRARVTRFGRVYPGGGRYVCVSAPKPGGFFALYFFHHGAGDWRAYPPSGVGPSIVYWSVKVKTPATRAAAGTRRRLRAAVKS